MAARVALPHLYWSIRCWKLGTLGNFARLTMWTVSKLKPLCLHVRMRSSMQQKLQVLVLPSLCVARQWLCVRQLFEWPFKQLCCKFRPRCSAFCHDGFSGNCQGNTVHQSKPSKVPTRQRVVLAYCNHWGTYISGE